MPGRPANEPKLIVPALGGLYDALFDLWYPMLRIAAGVILLYHGWVKVGAGLSGVTAAMTKSGFEPAFAFAAVAIFLETVGAIAVAVGFLTRIFAFVIAVELFIIAFVLLMPQGLFRMEGVLIWGLVMLAIAIRGGGPYSVDRALGREF